MMKKNKSTFFRNQGSIEGPSSPEQQRKQISQLTKMIKTTSRDNADNSIFGMPDSLLPEVSYTSSEKDILTLDYLVLQVEQHPLFYNMLPKNFMVHVRNALYFQERININYNIQDVKNSIETPKDTPVPKKSFDLEPQRLTNLLSGAILRYPDPPTFQRVRTRWPILKPNSTRPEKCFLATRVFKKNGEIEVADYPIVITANPKEPFVLLLENIASTHETIEQVLSFINKRYEQTDEVHNQKSMTNSIF